MRYENVTTVINFILEHKKLRFIKDRLGNLFVDVETTNGKYTVNTCSTEFTELIINLTLKEFKLILSPQEIQTLTTTLIANAKFEEELQKFETYERVGFDDDGNFVYKLSDCRFVKYNKKTVSIEESTSAKFRTLRLREQVCPNLDVKNVDVLDFIYNFFNCSSFEGDVVLLTWMLYTLKPNRDDAEIINPILLLNGEVETGKTTTLRFISSIISPEESGIETLSTVDNLALISSNRFLTTLDNVGKLSETMQSELLKTSTSATRTTDTKFKNNVPFTVKWKTWLALCGDNDVLGNDSLLNSSILIKLEGRETILSSDILTKNFNAQLANFLGVVFKLMPKILTKYEANRLLNNEKFADFIRFGKAVAEVISESYEEEIDFYQCYLQLNYDKKLAVTEASNLLSTLVEFCRECDFEGTATTLNRQLVEFAKKEDIYYVQREANVLSREIKKHKKILEELGLTIEHKKSKNRILTIKMANFDKEVM